jgi:hypothetical protein
MNEIGIDSYYIELVEDFPCKCEAELVAREGHFIRQYDSFKNGYNGNVAGRSRIEYNQEESKAISERCKTWRDNNKDKIKQKSKEYYEEKTNDILDYQRNYRENNKEKIKEYQERYRYQNREKRKEYMKEYYINKTSKN